MESPLCKHLKARLIKTISSEYIIEGYQDIFNIDVSNYFYNLDQIGIYECTFTGYQFYYPFNLSGDANFYQQLQHIEWYYCKWKWEFDIAFDIINPEDKVLEVGCGRGDFLKALSKKVNFCAGLEINDDVLNYADQNFKIFNKTVEEYAQFNKSSFNCIVSFQVLEHIADVQSFFKASIDLLSPGGKMIIAVPNNEANFFKIKAPDFKDLAYQQTLLLNLPPHHMGLWNETSFRLLHKLFPIELLKVYREPIQPWRKALNQRLSGHFNRSEDNFFTNNVSKLIFNLKSNFNTSFKLGDTILVVFRKV